MKYYYSTNNESLDYQKRKEIIKKGKNIIQWRKVNQNLKIVNQKVDILNLICRIIMLLFMKKKIPKKTTKHL